MAPRERSCRHCGERFAPTRFDQAHCQACSLRLRDAHLIESALFSQPNQSVDRISIATGISIERIRELATEGSLSAIPVGADMPTECVCPPGGLRPLRALPLAPRAALRRGFLPGRQGRLG